MFTSNLFAKESNKQHNLPGFRAVHLVCYINSLQVTTEYVSCGSRTQVVITGPEPGAKNGRSKTSQTKNHSDTKTITGILLKS